MVRTHTWNIFSFKIWYYSQYVAFHKLVRLSEMSPHEIYAQVTERFKNMHTHIDVLKNAQWNIEYYKKTDP